MPDADGPCYYCGQSTHALAGDPGEWPLHFAHADEPGVAKPHHTGCVQERLDGHARDVQHERFMERCRAMFLLESAVACQSIEDQPCACIACQIRDKVHPPDGPPLPLCQADILMRWLYTHGGDGQGGARVHMTEGLVFPVQADGTLGATILAEYYGEPAKREVGGLTDGTPTVLDNLINSVATVEAMIADGDTALRTAALRNLLRFALERHRAETGA